MLLLLLCDGYGPSAYEHPCSCRLGDLSVLMDDYKRALKFPELSEIDSSRRLYAERQSFLF